MITENRYVQQYNISTYIFMRTIKINKYEYTQNYPKIVKWTQEWNELTINEIKSENNNKHIRAVHHSCIFYLKWVSKYKKQQSNQNKNKRH